MEIRFLIGTVCFSFLSALVAAMNVTTIIKDTCLLGLARNVDGIGYC